MNKGRELRVFSRHPSHRPLRKAKIMLPVLTVLRLGSTTKGDLNYQVELNTVEGVKNSSSKLRMKKCFTNSGVKTAPWYICNSKTGNINKVIGLDDSKNPVVMKGELPYPIITKSLHGSRGMGNSLINSQKELEEWMKGKDLSNYIFEQYMNYGREYRIHVSARGECFYTCRKLLKNDTAKEKTFQRHDDNCSWAIETNSKFDKPVNWNVIVADCVKALKGLNLQIGAFDVRVQTAIDKKTGKKRDNPDYIIIESCSAPSFGDITLQKYLEEIPKLVNHLIKK